MFLIFCSRYDQEISWLQRQLQSIESFDMEVLFLEDLYECRDWQLKLNEIERVASVVLSNGRLVNNQNVTLFFNRVRHLSHPYWEKLEVKEKNYFLGEWNNFMFDWLQAFEPVLLNKPMAGSLSGYSSSPVNSQILARKAGFQIKAQYFSSDYCDPSKLQLGGISPDLKKIQMFDHKVFSPLLPTAVNEACVRFSRMVKCRLLEINVVYERGKYYFSNVNTLPQLSPFPFSFLKALAEDVRDTQGQLMEMRASI